MKNVHKNVIFAQPWGGLGDNLTFSNLPRLYNNENIGFNLSIFNYCRNTEIEILCWRQNKKVRKLKKFIPNIGFNVLENNGYLNFNNSYNTIQNNNVAHGFLPGKGYPDLNIPLSNTKIDKYYDLVLDLNAFSLFTTKFSYNEKEFKELKKFYSTQNSFNLSYPNIYKNNIYKNNLEVTSLMHLIEILRQTKTFVCLNSGSHILAAGLKFHYGFPEKIISINAITDTKSEVVKNKINNKFGFTYFDNVHYEKIKIIENEKNIYQSNNIDNFSEKMRSNIQIQRNIIKYKNKIKKITNF